MAKFVSFLDALISGRGLSGTIGDRVYFQRNGISYSRSKPVSCKNPRTPGQLAQREKFNVILKFLKPCKEFVRIGFQTKAKNMSEFNYAMSFLYKNTLMGEYPDLSIDYSKVLLSMGNLDGPFEPKIALVSPCEIEFTWQVNIEVFNYFLNDRAMVLVYNPAKEEAIIITDGNARISMRQLVTLPSAYAGDEVVCYFAFRDYHEKKVSDSQFLGRLKIEG
ncbi:MAG TPA: DUF6266 family protein [Prolixibacteraceae bacterium]|nr:DUF6266 family protein [Prolixibacteraceae bacterium]